MKNIIYISALLLSIVYIPCNIQGMSDLSQNAQALAQKLSAVSASLKACESHVPLTVHFIPAPEAAPVPSPQVPRDEAINLMDELVEALLFLRKNHSIVSNDGVGTSMVDGERFSVYQTAETLQWD